MTVATGLRLHRVTIQHAGTPIPDGDGGYTEVWTNAVPAAWFCAIDPVTAPRDLERIKGGTVVSQATYTIRGPYRADITTRSRLILPPGGRVFAIVGVVNPQLRPITLELEAVEVVS